jgi:hypothetical protein
MPGRSGARGRNGEAAGRRGTLADSLARTPAIHADARLRAPSAPIMAPQQTWDDADDLDPDTYQDDYDDYPVDPYDEREQSYSGGWDDDVEPEDDDGDSEAEYGRPITRPRERSLARPLTPAPPAYNLDTPVDPPLQLDTPLPQASAPDLIAYRPPRPRVRRATERLMKSARDPWTRARLILALAAAIIGFLYSPLGMGEPSNPLQVAQAQMALSPGASITSQVRPETQLKRPDLYDSYAQFQQWGGAACSAAAMSEILTAYGVRGATIGHEIDEFGSNISPNWGLLTHHAFALVAAKHGLRADESHSWTFNQIVYASEHLGIPVIVNVRISYGYYSFFAGGHFLVVVGGDAQGLAIVDSSEYYIHYLPKDVFYQMFTGYTAAIVPADDHYNLPRS